jgi:hypothetical protein
MWTMTEKIYTNGDTADWGKTTSIEGIEALISGNKRVLTKEELKQLLGEKEAVIHGYSNEQTNSD